MDGVISAGLTSLCLDFRTAPHGWVRRLHDLNLTLERGRVHALIGESGAGKSLVIAALTGMVPPGGRLSGRIEVDGHDLTRADSLRWWRVRGRIVGVVPQSVATFLTPTRTVGSQLRETSRELMGADPVALCHRVGLDPEVLRRLPHQVSGGMAQRVGLACALAGDPTVVLADEPTSSLDPALSRRTLALLRETADAGAAVLLVTHDLADLLDTGVADAVTLLRDGRMEAAGRPQDVFTPRAAGYAGDLVRALPRNGFQV